MKRKILRLLIFLLFSAAAAGLPSCRSAKDAGRPRHETERLHHYTLSKSDNRIVKEASGWLGTPYGYGKAEKGKACDCSGMVMSVYEKVTGVKLPRNSAQQQEFCRKIKKKDVRVGDLCFFATGKDPDKTSHVGIMVDATNFIHASTSKGVVVSDISQPYYVRTFKGYGRVPDR